MRRLSSKHAGFTLVEVLITMTLFTTASLVAAGAYTAATRLSRKAAAYAAVQQNTNFALEYLGKEIRNGRLNYDAYPADTIPAGAQSYLHLRTRGSSNTPVTVSLQSSQIILQKSGLGSASLTDNRVVVDRLEFYVSPAQACSYAINCVSQERVTVVLQMSSAPGLNSGPNPEVMNVQATFSARLYDL